MVNIVDLVKNQYEVFIRKREIKNLSKNYLGSVDRIESSFFSTPNVYLVGEVHTQQEHISFLADLVDLVKPQVLHTEGNFDENYIKHPIFSLEMLSDQLPEDMNSYIKEIFSENIYLYETPFHNLSSEELSGINELLISNSKKRIRYIENNLERWINLFNYIDGEVWLSQKDESIGDEVERNKSTRLLLYSIYKNKVELKPFDNEIEKDKVFQGIKEVDEVRDDRENAMLDYLKGSLNEYNRIICFCGRAHLRDDSPLVKELKERKIPYCRIILKEKGDSFLKTIKYNNQFKNI